MRESHTVYRVPSNHPDVFLPDGTGPFASDIPDDEYATASVGAGFIHPFEGTGRNVHVCQSPANLGLVGESIGQG